MNKSKFKARFKEQCKAENKPFDKKAFVDAWKQYTKPKKEAEQPLQVQEPVTAEEPNTDAVAPTIEVVEQTGAVLAENPQPLPSDTLEKKEEPKKDAEKSLLGDTEEDLKVLVGELHATASDVWSYMSDGKLFYTEAEIERLNRSGTKLLKKYDKTGIIAENSPEAAYGLAVTSVHLQLLSRAQQLKKDQKHAN